MNDLLSFANVYAGSIAHYLSKYETEKKEEIVFKVARRTFCTRSSVMALA